MSDQELSPSTGLVLAADGTPLKTKLRQAERAQRLRAAMLVAPLLLFILVTFVSPIFDMLYRSVDNQLVPDVLANTSKVIGDWDASKTDTPDEAVFRAFAEDLLVATKARQHTRVGSRLNYETAGISSLFRKTGRQIKKFDFDQPLKPQFLAMDDKWGETEIWQTIKRFSGSLTMGYYYAALDLKNTADGVEMLPENQRQYLMLFWRTLWMSMLITGLCFSLAFPVAYLLAILPMKSSNLLMILVLLPFWTSLLARTSAWKVLLQREGVINDTLVFLRLVPADGRLELINNSFGTIVAMTHILLPFMIMPLFSVMRTIPPSYVRAARSLGATEFTSFWRIYFPQTISGIGAGCILVFILAIGYYITPELVGGRTGVFISSRIAYHVLSSLNWGLAAALGSLLLIGVLVVYWLYDRIVGIDNVKLG